MQAQKWIENATERRRTRHAVFHALVSNRATRMNADFIRALNRIDLEFSSRRNSKDRAVIDAWRALFGEYGNAPQDNASAGEMQSWNERIGERLVSLLFAMSHALGYDFSEEQLRRGIYYPRGRANLEQTQLAILDGIKNIIEGKAAVPIKVTETPSSPEFVSAQTAMMKKSVEAYGPDGALRVRMVSD